MTLGCEEEASAWYEQGVVSPLSSGARMPYVLGIDVGRTRGTAAVCRRVGDAFGRPEVVPLDGAARWVRSVLLLSKDGDVLVGNAAERRAAAEPDRVARDVLARVGDEVPVLLGGALYPAETLAAALVAWIADVVAEAEGGHPEHIAITHPPDWGSYRRGLFREALDAAEVSGVLLLPTVVAAAETAFERRPVPAGSALAVALVGGRQCEFAVVHRGPAAFELVKHCAPVDAEAGDHLDDLLVEAVLAEAGGTATAELRVACGVAKERLSVAPEVRVPGDVVVTRTRFEELARPALATVVDQLRRLVATVPADQLGGAVLGGGTARVPLLATLAAAAVDCPVTVEEDPATAVCRGAALAARPRLAVPDPHQAGDPVRGLIGPRAPGSHPDFRPVSSPQVGRAGAEGSDPGFRPVGAFSGNGLAPDGSHPSFRPVTDGGRLAVNGSRGAAEGSHPGFRPVDGAGAPNGDRSGGDGLAADGSHPSFRPVAGAGRSDDPGSAPAHRPSPTARRQSRDSPSTPTDALEQADRAGLGPSADHPDDPPPPPRPPVEITPLEPPRPRFALSRRSRRDPDADEDSR
ncbi:hypothetical protein [Actinokineospora sp.]|uniref:hypothetical protein n=1 Tax=Actinokineospora sp. TaxID=1872133 RepID=UPI004037A3F9